MKHRPYGDNTGLTTNELVCVLMSRLDASSCLISLLALMIEVSDELPVDNQWKIAGSLHDAARIIEERPMVGAWMDQINRLAAALGDEGVTL